jgi:hypothetical protein
MYNIIFAVCGIEESDNHINKDRLLIQIRALEWARGQVGDLQNKERKEKRR